jgi:hypothetical protein
MHIVMLVVYQSCTYVAKTVRSALVRISRTRQMDL